MDGLPDPSGASRASLTPRSFRPLADKDMPMLDGLKRISTVLGLMAATAAVSQAQVPASGNNQATANAVAAALRSSPNLSPYRIEIETRDGMATLSGTVATAE